MKNAIRIVLIFIAFTVVYDGVYGQLEVGAKAGYSLTTIDIGFDVISDDGQVYGEFSHSYHGGLYFSYGIGTKWTLQSEVLAYRTGARFDIPALIDETTVMSTQVRVPLFVSYEVFPRFQIEGGIFVGYVISVWNEQDGDKQVLTEDYHDWDFGFIIGGSYDLSDRLSLSARFNYGQRDMVAATISTDFPLIRGVQVYSFENRSTDLSLNYRF